MAQAPSKQQAKRITALYVQDMGATHGQASKANWIDAHQAFYVQGSSQQGSMGATLVPFGQRAQADAFAQRFGGKVLECSRMARPVHRADTVLLTTKERIRLAFVADRPGDWMLHCHILEHEETGMMGIVRVA